MTVNFQEFPVNIHYYKKRIKKMPPSFPTCWASITGISVFLGFIQMSSNIIHEANTTHYTILHTCQKLVASPTKNNLTSVVIMLCIVFEQNIINIKQVPYQIGQRR